MKAALLSLAVSLAAFGALRAADAPVADEVAVIKTTEGTMVAAFWPKEAPGTVANFIKLAKEKFYDGTAFHRIIPGFMIQGGDPLTKEESQQELWGTGDPGYKIKAEFNDHRHVTGVLSMARSADPDSAGCQFFIMLGAAPHLDGKYTAFGHLIKGEDVLAKIAETPTTMAPNGEPSRPTKRVEIKSVEIVPAAKVK